MMAMFFAQRVILGKASFEAQYGEQGFIPQQLKAQVAEILIDSGMQELVPVEYISTN